MDQLHVHLLAMLLLLADHLLQRNTLGMHDRQHLMIILMSGRDLILGVLEIIKIL